MSSLCISVICTSQKLKGCKKINKNLCWLPNWNSIAVHAHNVNFEYTHTHTTHIPYRLVYYVYVDVDVVLNTIYVCMWEYNMKMI